jgi:thiamine biosynthesis lipoprotein
VTMRLCRVEFRAVGTICSAAVTARGDEERQARRALAAAQTEVSACESALSRFDLASDLSRLNASAGRWTRIDRRLAEALEFALRAREDTGGRFDPTVLPALVAAGYDRSFEQLVERPARRPAGWRPGARIDVDPDAGLARVEAGAAVDLGGIGKGYAADRALEAMLDAWPPARGVLVDLGGDLAAAGDPPGGGPWRIAVADARTAGVTAGVLLVRSGGVATSGRDVRRFGRGRSLHHLIDPSTGEPARPGPLAVTVVAPTAAEAEAHATALAISGPGAAASHVAARPLIAAYYLPSDGDPLQLGNLPFAQPRVIVRAA